MDFEFKQPNIKQSKHIKTKNKPIKIKLTPNAKFLIFKVTLIIIILFIIEVLPKILPEWQMVVNLIKTPLDFSKVEL